MCGRAGVRACGRAGVRACGRAGVRVCISHNIKNINQRSLDHDVKFVIIYEESPA